MTKKKKKRTQHGLLRIYVYKNNEFFFFPIVFRGCRGCNENFFLKFKTINSYDNDA